MYKKSHTCEEGGAFIDDFEKQLFLKKTGWSGPIKNLRISIFTMLYFFFFKKKKKKERNKNIWIYHYFTPVYQKA